MGAALLDMVPMMLGAVLAPAWVIITLALLTGERGITKASAFVAGTTLTRVLQGVLFGAVFAESADSTEGKGLVVSTLLLVVGLVLLNAAYRKWRKEEDPDAPPPAWMSTIGALSPLKAFAAGAGLMAVGIKQWVFTLSAISTITYAELGTSSSVLLYALFVVVAQLLCLLAILAALVAPARAQTTLAHAQAWLERNNRAITIAVSLIFGLFFTYKGIAGLMG